MTTKKNVIKMGAVVTANEGANVETKPAEIVATDLQEVEKQEVNKPVEPEIVATVQTDPFSTATTYQEAKEQAALLNGETVAKIDEEINSWLRISTNGVLDNVKLLKELTEDAQRPVKFWTTEKMGRLLAIPDEIAKLEAEKTAGDVRKKSENFAKLLVSEICKTLPANVERINAELAGDAIDDETKSILETELKTVSEIVLDGDQTALIEQARKQIDENYETILLNVWKTGSIFGNGRSSVSRGTTTRKTSSGDGETVKKSNYCDWTISKDGRIVASRPEKGSTAALLAFCKSIPAVDAGMTKLNGSNWTVPTSPTSPESWCSKLKTHLVAAGYTIDYGMVSKEV